MMPEGGSTYKSALAAMKPGDQLIASQLACDFLLPADAGKKIALVAGGIGVTPFRAHIGHLLATGEQRDIHFYYCNKFYKDIAYHNFFMRAKTELDMHWVNVLSDEVVEGCEHGFITADMIERHTPDYRERIWYLSGPPGMVNAYKKLLRDSGVPGKQIVTDFFPGLA
jgi:Flavodoxin reductases (ferredoxin-NADPH reductases) family 1